MDKQGIPYELLDVWNGRLLQKWSAFGKGLHYPYDIHGGRCSILFDIVSLKTWTFTLRFAFWLLDKGLKNVGSLESGWFGTINEAGYEMTRTNGIWKWIFLSDWRRTPLRYAITKKFDYDIYQIWNLNLFLFSIVRSCPLSIRITVYQYRNTCLTNT